MNNLYGISGKSQSGKDTIGKIIQYIDWKKSVEKGESKSLHYTIEDFLNNDISFVTDYKIKKFADKLKDIACLLIGCTRQQLEDQEFKEKSLGEEWTQYGVSGFNEKIVDKTEWGSRRVKVKETVFEYLEKPMATLQQANNVSKILRNTHVWFDTEIVKKELTPRKLLQLLGTECGREIIHPNIWVNSLFVDWKWHTYRSPSFSEEDLKQPFKYPKWIITDVRFLNEVEAIKERGGTLIRVERSKQVTSDKLSQHPSETTLDDYTGWDIVIRNNGTIEELVKEIEKQLT